MFTNVTIVKNAIQAVDFLLARQQAAATAFVAAGGVLAVRINLLEGRRKAARALMAKTGKVVEQEFQEREAKRAKEK